MLKHELEKVADFQKVFGAEPVAKGTHIFQCPFAVIDLNRKIIVEELEETRKKGVLNKDMVELADGIGDTVYVIAHATNQLGRTNNAGRDDAANVMLADAVARIEYALTPGMAFHDEDIDRNLSIAEIIIRGVAAVYGIPIEAVFNAVHASNMTKVFPDGSIRKNEFGKVLKPEGYEKATPKIIEILKAEGLM